MQEHPSTFFGLNLTKFSGKLNLMPMSSDLAETNDHTCIRLVSLKLHLFQSRLSYTFILERESQGLEFLAELIPVCPVCLLLFTAA